MTKKTATKKASQPDIAGLYAITPDIVDTDQLCALVEASLIGGASVIQYRNKTADHDLRIQQSSALLDLCHKHHVPLIINDLVELCLAIDADGVHLGSNDGNLAEARQRLGAGKILGASCYNRFELALEARAADVDYLAFGSCFDSGTKPAAARVPLELLGRVRKEVGLPLVAIGGITLNNAAQAINAGADAIAVIAALFSAANVTQTTQQFSNFFTPSKHHDLSPANFQKSATV